MSSQLRDSRWIGPVTADNTEPMRKAEYIMQLVRRETGASEFEIVRQALYMGDMSRSPGPLVDSIARLCAARTGATYLMTTNFDNLMETQLLEYGQSVESSTLDDCYSEEGAPRLPRQGEVVHLRGLIEPGQPGRGPLILTESSFLAEGDRVREVVRHALVHSTVIFVGISLADPNLIGPLWGIKNSDQPHQRPFFLVVAAPSKAMDHEHRLNSRAYVVKRSGFLEDEFGVRNVFAKSYMQLSQIFAELALAAKEPTYLEGDGSGSNVLRYGNRLRDALERIHGNLSVEDADEGAIPYTAALELNHRLYARLYEEDGIVSSLKDYLSTMPSAADPKLARLYRDHLQDFQRERFGLFLWVREPRSELGTGPNIRLRLLGTSSYVHREAWSLDRLADIEPYSRHTAARAAFEGKVVYEGVSVERPWQLWRSIFAVPFFLEKFRSSATIGPTAVPLDTLPIGVITLNSTNNESGHPGGGPKSILNTLTTSAVRVLRDNLALVAAAAVATPIGHSEDR